MVRRQLLRAFGAVLAAVLAAAGVQIATGAPAAAAQTAYYDASRAGEFRTSFDQAAQADADVTPFVVGGRPATENYPWLAYTSGCTGTLIKSDWVVTARHCPTPSSVRVGSVNRTSGGTVVGVRRAINNPTIDVKLLQLSSSVSYAPAPIPATSGAVGTATRIIGWGLTCPFRGCGPTPTVAQELDTSIRSDGACFGINGPYEICTDNTDGDSGACYGDSGGPQVRRIGGVWHVVGATSRSGNNHPICATGPSIYGDLSSIRSWIDARVGGLPA